MDDGYWYFKKNHPKIFIMFYVQFWWMDENWHQYNIMVVVIRELNNSWKVFAIELQLSFIRVRSYMRWVVSFVIHATCPITLMGVKIEWVANGHCNSNTKLQAQLQNTLFFIVVVSLFWWDIYIYGNLIILVPNHQPLIFLIGSQENWPSGHLSCTSLILKLCIKLGKVIVMLTIWVKIQVPTKEMPLELISMEMLIWKWY
jgi:hypothetical protein